MKLLWKEFLYVEFSINFVCKNSANLLFNFKFKTLKFEQLCKRKNPCWIFYYQKKTKDKLNFLRLYLTESLLIFIFKVILHRL